MRILVDLRCLQSLQKTGVENYVSSLIENMLLLDRVNQYLFFYNGFKKFVPPDDLHFVNSENVFTGIPNKFLNLGMNFFKYPMLEKLTGYFDVVFLPNPSVVAFAEHKKLAVVAHDLSPLAVPETFDLKRRIWHGLVNMKKLYRRADIIFAVSEFTKLDLIQRVGVEEKQVFVAHPALPQSREFTTLTLQKLRETRTRLNLPGEYLLYLGTVEPRKNVQGLLKAFEALKSPASLVIAGRPGWKYGPIFKSAARSRKRGRIVYLNYVDEADKPAIIKLAKAVVYPSIYEGFGFVPLEAFALGTPVIASSVTAMPEACGPAAILVDPYKTEDLTEAMNIILTDDVLRGSLILEGQTQVKKFNWKKTAETVLLGLSSLQ
ncbi:MAG TPA: glycosyltransferase family 1 protein [Patescibacteria group bacterium]|nr:glycosyltransferase family 1 protein [Patescibacteria group bacterium]